LLKLIKNSSPKIYWMLFIKQELVKYLRIRSTESLKFLTIELLSI